MRFKARLASEQLSLLYSLIGPISRLSQHAVLHVDPQHLRISTRDADGISCFSELKTRGGIFLDCKIESMADNVVVFEIDLVQWRTAMQSIVGDGKKQRYNRDDSHDTGMEASVTVMKLAKRQGMPCLCLETKCAGSVEVIHAIPVRVMRAADMQYHLPPEINRPQVQLEMTNEKPLRVVVERIKTMSPHVFLEGNMKGDLTLRVLSDGSSIKTFFTKLLPRFEDTLASQDEDQMGNDENSRSILKVDTKKLSTCLAWQQSMTKTVSSALLCMVENEMLVLHVILNPQSVGFFTWYVPVHHLTTADLHE